LLKDKGLNPTINTKDNVNFKFIVQDKISSKLQINQFVTNYICCHSTTVGHQFYYTDYENYSYSQIQSSIFASPMMKPGRQKLLQVTTR